MSNPHLFTAARSRLISAVVGHCPRAGGPTLGRLELGRPAAAGPRWPGTRTPHTGRPQN